MSAAISTVKINGRSISEMFSGNNLVPWHGEGQVVNGLLTSREAIEAAHLGWTVAPYPISVAGKQCKLEDFQGIVRTDTMDTLGIMKGRYEVIQNSECFDFADSLAADGAIKYETAGALRGGKQVWMLAKYDGSMTINNDKHDQYLLLVTSHDGSKCLELLWTAVRVVCANTLALALRDSKGRGRNSVKIRHSTNWEDKRDEAKRILGLTQDYFADMRTALEGLNQQPMSTDDMDCFSKLLFPSKGEDKGEEVAARTSNMRWGVQRLFNRPSAGTSGLTRWDAFNASTDFADHFSTIRGQNTRMESALMGSGAELKQKAYELLTSADLMNQLMAVKNYAPVVAPTIQAPAGVDDFSRLLAS